MRTFFYDENGNKKLCKYNFVSVKNVDYDDVVDRSMFRPDSEQIRNFGLTGSGSNGSPVYDKDEPSDDEVRIRSGKLDRTEVAVLMKRKAEEFNEVNEDEMKAKLKKEADELSKARQEYLDKATGFTGVPKGEVK